MLPLRAGEEIVDAEHVVPCGQQPLAQMRAEEAGAAGDQDAFDRVLHCTPSDVNRTTFSFISTDTSSALQIFAAGSRDCLPKCSSGLLCAMFRYSP